MTRLSTVPQKATGACSPFDAALSYARRGWPVIPLHSVTERRRCTCGNPECASAGKHPRTAHGLKDATTDRATIGGWWTRWPNANVGIATGAVSGLLVLDVDPRHDGDDTLDELTQEHGDVPQTVQSRTGGGGSHYFFRHPGADAVIRNRAGVASGLDVRADGGYVVAPPSVTERPYEWCEGQSPDGIAIADAPRWLLALLESDPRRECARQHGDGEPIPEGERNDTLTSLAGSMRRRGMTEDEMAAALLVVNCKRCVPPLDETEVLRIAASVSRYLPESDETEGGRRMSLDETTTKDASTNQRRPRFEFISDADLQDQPPPEWLIDGIIPAGGLVVLTGQPAHGKTFLAIHIAYCVAAGIPFGV